ACAAIARNGGSQHVGQRARDIAFQPCPRLVGDIGRVKRFEQRLRRLEILGECRSGKAREPGERKAAQNGLHLYPPLLRNPCVPANLGKPQTAHKCSRSTGPAQLCWTISSQPSSSSTTSP